MELQWGIILFVLFRTDHYRLGTLVARRVGANLLTLELTFYLFRNADPMPVLHRAASCLPILRSLRDVLASDHYSI